MNNLIIVGNVGNTRRSSYDGKPILNFSVAVSEGKDKTTWFDCALWGDRVEKNGKYIQKGGKVAVAGSVSADSYNGEGKLKVLVRSFWLISPPRSEENIKAASPIAQAAADEFNEDIPF